jgi:hypothetical protein
MNITLKPLLMNEKKGLLKGLVADLKQDVPNLEATVERVSIEAIEMPGIVQSSFADFDRGPECDERARRRHRDRAALNGLDQLALVMLQHLPRESPERRFVEALRIPTLTG